MPLQRAANKISFRTKVLVPVIIVMVLIVIASMWLANQRIQEQIRASADQQLQSAEVNLKFTQKNRVNDLKHTYSNAKNDSRFKAYLQWLGQKKPLDSDQRKTVQGTLVDLIGEDVADVIVLTTR